MNSFDHEDHVPVLPVILALAVIFVITLNIYTLLSY